MLDLKIQNALFSVIKTTYKLTVVCVCCIWRGDVKAYVEGCESRGGDRKQIRETYGD